MNILAYLGYLFLVVGALLVVATALKYRAFLAELHILAVMLFVAGLLFVPEADQSNWIRIPATGIFALALVSAGQKTAHFWEGISGFLLAALMVAAISGAGLWIVWA